MVNHLMYNPLNINSTIPNAEESYLNESNKMFSSTDEDSDEFEDSANDNIFNKIVKSIKRRIRQVQIK